MSQEGVHEAILDMCRFGVVSKDEFGAGLCRKPTKLLTNTEPMAGGMSWACGGGHRHVAFVSGRPSAAAIHPAGFCAVLVGSIDLGIRQRSERADDLLMELEK